ncbi:MAG: hypothetical protein J6B43_02365 [Lachnospiraceae bacterium]|nr:hypothetical protein [Lachnospiraceae bacterium]
MGRKKFRNNGKMQETRERIRMQNCISRELPGITRELTEEMNLRLLLDWETPEAAQDPFLQKLFLEVGCMEQWRDLCAVPDILYVEQITVTGIRFPQPQKKESFPVRMGKKIKAFFTHIRNFIR